MSAEQIVISRPRAEELLRAVVAEVGDDQVTGTAPVPGEPQHHQAVYVLDGACCCLLAHLLTRAGVELVELERWNRIAVGDLPIERLWIEMPALELLGRAQEMQDDGTPWGVVVDAVLDGSGEGAGVVTR